MRLSVRAGYIIAIVLMGISVLLSFTTFMSYANLNQSFAMMFFMTLLVMTRSTAQILSLRGEILFISFCAISAVAIATKASLELFDTILYGPLISFAGVCLCVFLIDPDNKHNQNDVHSTETQDVSGA